MVPNLLHDQEHYEGSVVQVLGELKQLNVNATAAGSGFCIQVHILRNFSGVNIARYQEAIAKQSVACPRMCLRRQNEGHPAVQNSPAPSSFLDSDAIDQNADVSKDLLADSSIDEDCNMSTGKVIKLS